MKRRRNWRLDRVYFFDEAGALASLPAEWTDVVVCDGFIAEAGGRAPFRTSCLLDLADRLAYLLTMSPGSGDGVQENSP